MNARQDTGTQKVVFVLRRYSPDPSPSASLFDHVIQDFCTRFGDKFDIHIVAWTDDPTRREERCAHARGQCTVHRVPEVSNLPPVLRRLRDLTRGHLTGQTSFVPEGKQLDEVLKGIGFGNTDVLIPATPREIVSASWVARRRRLRLLPVFLEPLLRPMTASPVRRVLGGVARRRVDRLERALVERAQHAFALAPMKDHFSSMASVVTIVEHPMVRDLTVTPHQPPRFPVRLVYAGGLDRANRNPIATLEILQLARAGSVDLVLDLFSYGNCEDLVRAPQFETLVRAHGSVSPESAISAMRGADLLVTIGNLDPGLTPSKLFDCISTGKPILHFYWRSDDPYLKYLQRYPLSLCVDLREHRSRAAAAVTEAVVAWHGESMDWADIASEFEECRPKSIVDKLVEQCLNAA